MAPEVIAHNYEYTKSVDIWATGIIMYELLTGGRHPLYLHSEYNRETYKKKLLNIDEIVIAQQDQELFSWLAKSLFQKLTKLQSLQRYTAHQAL